MNQPLLILDVDETLVYGTEQPLPERAPDFRVGQYFVYRRPHLETFLAAVAAFYELAVWSSASSAYVAGIVTNIFADSSQLKFVWAADRCTLRYHSELQERFPAKNLHKVKSLGYRLERVLMVDDSPEKLAQNYGNHVQVRPFTGEIADDELVRLTPFLTRLASQANFRTVEKRDW